MKFLGMDLGQGQSAWETLDTHTGEVGGGQVRMGAYARLVPRRYQSGQMDRSGRSTKRGSALLRQVLNQAGWMAARCNPELQAFFLRLGGGHKKRRKPAIVAVMRKLLVIAWALLRDGTVYPP